MVQAHHRAISKGTEIAIAGFHLGVRDIQKIQEAVWSPWVNGYRSVYANSARDDPKGKSAGFQHLCPEWKGSVGAVLMPKLTLFFRAGSASKRDRQETVKLVIMPESSCSRIWQCAMKGFSAVDP